MDLVGGLGDDKGRTDFDRNGENSFHHRYDLGGWGELYGSM